VVKKPEVPPDYLLILFKDLLLVLLPVFLALAYAFLERPEKRLARLVPILVVIGIGYNLGLVSARAWPLCTTYSYACRKPSVCWNRLKRRHVLVYEGRCSGLTTTNTCVSRHWTCEAGSMGLRRPFKRRGGLPAGRAAHQYPRPAVLHAAISRPERRPAVRFLEHRIGDFILYDRQSRAR